MKKDVTEMTSLERNVYGRNLINRLTVKNLEAVLPQLENYIGKKIELADGSKSKNFVIDLPEYKNRKTGSEMTVYVHFGYNTLWLKQNVTVKTEDYILGGYGVNYYENNIALGELENGELVNVEDLNQLKHSYKLSTVLSHKQVLRKKQKLEKLQDEVRSLKSELSNIIDLF